MKIEKNKIYYHKNMKHLFLANYDDNVSNTEITNKIAVHCPTHEVWDYVTEKMGYDWGTGMKDHDRVIFFDSQDWDYKYNFDENYSNKYHLITIEQFRELYKKDEMKKSILELTDNEVIHAPTLEIAERLCKRFDELGLKRWEHKSYLEWDNYDKYDSQTCFNTNTGQFADIEFFSQEYTILTISDLSDFDKMKTKVTILGQQEPNVKKIEFVKLLSDLLNIENTNQKPSSCKEVILIEKNYSKEFDLMYGIFEEEYTNCIFLGHFNDGVV